MMAFNVVLLISIVSGNEVMQQSLRSSDAPKTLIGVIAGKLPAGFELATADKDGNDIVTWKELYDTLAEYKIPNLDTGVVKKLVTDFSKDGAKEGAEAGLDVAEFSKLVAYLKKKSAKALIPKNPNAFETGCYEEEDKGKSYKGLVSTTTSAGILMKVRISHGASPWIQIRRRRFARYLSAQDSVANSMKRLMIWGCTSPTSSNAIAWTSTMGAPRPLLTQQWHY